MSIELMPRACFKIELGTTPEEYALLLRIKEQLGDGFFVRYDERLSGFTVVISDKNVERLSADIRSLVSSARGEMVQRTYCPILYRFMGEKYIDDFFTKGELRLATFGSCCSVEGRQDRMEGFGSFYCDDQPLAVSNVGLNVFMLCSSLSLWAYNPKGYKKALLIRDGEGLMREIAQGIVQAGYSVEAFTGGPCYYSSHRFDVTGITGGTDVAEAVRNIMGDIGEKLYYAKDARPKYMDEHEYRMVWLVSDRVDVEHLMVNVRRPEKFCECIDSPRTPLVRPEVDDCHSDSSK